MKAWALAFSLAVNAVLLGWLALPRPGRALARDLAGERSSHRPRAAPPPNLDGDAARLTWAVVDSPNAADLAARLRAASVPADMVRALVAAKIRVRFAPRLRALLEPDADASPVCSGPWGSAPADAWRVEEFERVVRARAAALREALGVSYYDDPRWATAARERFGDFPPPTLDALRSIEDDYADLAGEIRALANGAGRHGDAAALAVLEQDRETDLEAVLTPGEFAAYRQGHLPLTASIRSDSAEATRQWAVASAVFQP